jgi:hypothetical protein
VAALGLVLRQLREQVQIDEDLDFARRISGTIGETMKSTARANSSWQCALRLRSPR